MKNSNHSLPWQVQGIISTSRSLYYTGSSAGSTGEQIAAAFVLNKQEYLPVNYPDMVEAWERLDNWQEYVKLISNRGHPLYHPLYHNLSCWKVALSQINDNLSKKATKVFFENPCIGEL